MNNILISVVMSVYNGEKYVSEAIESILNQTYGNFEFIIINDGSTDKTDDILNFYLKNDDRIKIFNNIQNKGLIYSLNKGLEIAQGKYIARMDADDISENNRFEKQIEYLEKNKHIALCGTYIKIFKNSNILLRKVMRTETDFRKIKFKLLFRNYIAHPTVMIRKEIIDRYNLKYNCEDKGMEDYGLWLHLSKYENIAIISESLLKYRVSNFSITSNVIKNIDYYKSILNNLFSRELLDIFPELTERDISIHTEIAMINNLCTYEYTLDSQIEYLNKFLKLANSIQYFDSVFNEQEIKKLIIECSINQVGIFKTFILNLKYYKVGVITITNILMKKLLKKIR